MRNTRLMNTLAILLSKHRRSIVIALLCSSSITMWWWHHQSTISVSNIGTPVRAIVLQGYTHIDSRLTGTIHARTESNLGFRVSGKIIEKLVDQGTHVKKGQVLMRIDPTDLKLAQQVALNAVTAAAAEKNRALKNLLRMRELLRVEAISMQEYEQAKAQADTSTANLNAATANATQAANTTGYSILQADADGIIMTIKADVGQVISIGETIVSLAHDGEREAVINLPENALSEAHNATAAYLYTDPKTLFSIKLRELSSMADPVTRTYQARYTLNASNQTSALGATVSVIFQKQLTNQAEQFAVPISAIYDIGTGPKVWVINKKTSTVDLHKIQIISLGDETANITGDLKSGENIIALGAHLLHPKELVYIINQQEANA